MIKDEICKVDDAVPPRDNVVVCTIHSEEALAAVGGGLLVSMLTGSLLMNKRNKRYEEVSDYCLLVSNYRLKLRGQNISAPM